MTANSQLATLDSRETREDGGMARAFNGYTPILHAMPDDTPGRFAALRRFAEIWANKPIPQTVEPHSITLTLEPGVDLGTGFRHWLALNRDMDAAAVNLFRDEPVTHWVNGQALSLLLQGEGDFFWAVNRSDVPLSDPPVIGFGLDYDSDDERWVSRGQLYGSIVEFALSHMAFFIHRDGLNFVTPRVDYPQIVHELTDAFDFYSRIGNLHIFESDDIVAFVPGRACLIVASWRKLPSRRIPEPIRRLNKSLFG